MGDEDKKAQKRTWQRRPTRFSNPPSNADKKDYFGRNVFAANRKIFETYMWETPLLDRLAFYVTQGQLPNIRNRIYNIGKRTFDNRVHAVAFLPSGSGKAGFTEYSGQLATKCGLVFYIMGDATDTALIGWRRQVQEYNQETQRVESIVKEELGCLNPESKNHIIHYNEADLLFDARKTDWAKSTMTYFQKTMNTCNSFDNILSRDTGLGRIEFNSSVSFLIVSKPPESFYKTITSTGFLQRTLMAYIAQDWERKKAADKKTLTMFCDSTENVDEDVTVDDVADVLIAINKYYKGVGKIAVSKDASDILLKQIFNILHEPLEKMSPYAQKTMSEFVSRWQEQIINLSYHNCFARLGKQITVQDVVDAKNVVYPLWKMTINAIEDGLEQPDKDKHKWKEELSVMITWTTKLAKKYGKDGWIPRNALVKVLASRNYGWGCNKETARNRVLRAEQEGYLLRKETSGSPVVKISPKPRNISI